MIYNWPQLEIMFHEQLFKVETTISLMNLMNVKRYNVESIDAYLNRFRELKARCSTQIPKHELVQMAVVGIEFSIRKKLANQ